MEKLIIAFLSLLSLKMMRCINNGPDNVMYALPEEQYDGPYVQYKGNRIFINYILEDGGTKVLKTNTVKIQQKKDVTLKVVTDIPGKSFQVQLKKELRNEKSEFPKAKKLFVLSDIEGNFGAFRKLLQANKIINEDFKWKFDEGHLVLIGDFFDRGQQVTETLWLIYYLEEMARADGGYVHFILGNHEIMNLSGDLRYIDKKYLNNAGLLKQPYINLYDENSELGRWLRTKNIVEKIGNIVFAHGGISANINRMNLSIPDINTLAKPYYADTTFNYTDQRSDVIMGDAGPFWYRGYYEKNNSAIPAQIDSTLALFNADHIVTGHSLVADTISGWYKGKLFNTDVHHAAGKSEALLIEKDKFYRVNAEGRRFLLLEEIRKND